MSKTYVVGNKSVELTDKQSTQLQGQIDDFNKGCIVVCPRCHRVDINPIKHLIECDPTQELQRQQAQEYYD